MPTEMPIKGGQDLALRLAVLDKLVTLNSEA